MSPCFSASSIVFLLFFLKVHSNNWNPVESYPSLLGFELPEIDGSPVDETCRIFDMDSDVSPTTKAAISPATTMQVISTQMPAVQSSARKPVTKVPIRNQPVARGPIRNQNNNQALRLLYQLLANNRGRWAGSQPMRSLTVMSSSEESGAGAGLETSGLYLRRLK